MSAENEDQFSLEQHVETTNEAPKRSRISYTREFLLSLSELDICKKLPSDFDKSILGEFGDVSSSVPEWPRVPGSLSSQSFRRGEYGSSPPTRGDNNYSRGVQGRWDSRSSGSNDRDGDSQSDKDSDSGKRFGNQPRRPWQNPEHDGLLGSGAFPRPSGHATGATAPKVRGDAQYQLSRSNEPYHPPRPYKAVPHLRRDDTFDDETFGSSELSSQDREEEERKRRASFELFRKDNIKSFQEKKQFPDKHIEHSDPDIAALLRDSEDKKFSNEDSGPDDLVPPASKNDPTKCSVPAQAPASRPRVPPGFRSSVPEKNLVTKILAPYPASEVRNIGLEGKINHAKSNLVGEGASGNQVVQDSSTCTVSNEQQFEIKAVHIPFKDVGEKVIQSSDLEVSDNLAGVLHPSCKASKLFEAYEPRKGYGVADFDDEEMSGHQVMGSSGQNRSASILDKLFGGSITGNSVGSSGFPENNNVKADDTASNLPYQSSKFTHWFGEEKKPVEDLSSGKPKKDLLSLIVNGDKNKPHAPEVSDEKNLEHIPPIFPFKSNEPVDRFIPSTATSGAVGIHEPLFHRKSQDATPGVLTCEDLEQSMLSEINDNSSYVKQQPELAWDVFDSKAVQPKAEVNNLASQHILSLLQKGTSMIDPAPSLDLGVQSSANVHVHEVGSISTVNNLSQVGAEVHNSDNNLTLETFFGTSFMKELQSVQAPVSVQRGSGTTRTESSGPHGFPFPLADAGFRPSGASGYESSKTNLEDEILTSNVMQQTNSNKTENHLLGFDVRRNEVGSKHSGIGGFQNRTDGVVEIQLPEEESLLTVGDSMKPQNSMFMHVGGAPKGEPISSSTASLDIVDKLAALNAALKDERSMVSVPDGPFLRGSYNSLEPEIPFQNIRGQPSSTPFPHMQQMNYGRPLIQTLDSHLNRMNPQMKFVGPESMIHHEPPHHPFPGNVFRPPFDHSAGGPTRFDLPAHNHMLQHMHVPGQFLPPHLLQGHPRGAPMPPHPINHMAGYISEPDPMQGFPLSHRQPSYGGPGMPMPMPAPGIGGSNHPEALGKLIEMEMRANSKQMHPVGPGAYGHEVDMGFRYR